MNKVLKTPYLYYKETLKSHDKIGEIMKLLTTSLLLLASSLAYGEVDLTKSQVQWEAKKVISGGHQGLVPLTKASLTQKDGKIVSGEFSVSIKEASVSDLEGEWKQKFLDHIKSDDFFSVSKYPEAHIKITQVDQDKAKGLLTIKDKTHPVEFNILRKDKSISGQVVFDRTNFDIIYGSNNFFKNLGDKAISNDVKVTFNIVLK